MKVMLVMSVFFGLLGASHNTPTPTPQNSELLPFLGTIIAGLLTSGVAYMAYRSTKRTDRKQEKIQESLTVIQGFNDLTQRLQKTVEQQDEKLDELDKWHRHLVGKINEELEECNKDRVNLRIEIAKIQTEVQLNREMLNKYGKDHE